MNELKELLKDIEKLRDRLHQLINDRNADLGDPEIIAASHELNAAIHKYNNLIGRKINGHK